MAQEALKLELIEWLSKLDDHETIAYLKVVKDSKSGNHDWWDDLTEEQKQGIERGLKDIDQGRTIPQWQQDEVNRRVQLIEKGEIKTRSWNEAKKDVFKR